MNDDYIKRSAAEKFLTANAAVDADRHRRTWAKAICAIKDVPAADVEPKQRWIPVVERLPERGELVLTAIYGTDMIVQEEGESLEDAVRRARSGMGRVDMAYLDDDGIWTDYVFGGPMIVLPRYWMPLPAAPEADHA